MRPRSLQVLLAIALVAALAQPAAAAGPAALDATVASLVLEGSLRLEGTLSALTSTGQFDPGRELPGSLLRPAGRDPRVAPTDLHFTAREILVETDLESRTGSPFAGPSDRRVESAGFSDVAARALPARDGFEFYLAPMAGHDLPTVRLDAVQARLQPAAVGPAEPDRKIESPTRGPLLPAAGPAALASGGLRTLHVEGDVVLMLWEWDLELLSAGKLVRSGYNYTATAPSAGHVGTVGNSESRLVFVYARGAALDIALPYDVSAAVALLPSAATFDGRLVLQGPVGRLTTVDGEHPLRDGDWVDGAFAATFSELDATAFHATLHGTGRQAHLAGLTVAIAGPLPSSAGPLMALVAASGIALLGSWRMWGRRQFGLAGATSAPEADDELRTLRWLDERSAQAAVLWDSDLMRAFDWSAERAQGVLRGLQAKGQVRCKDVALPPGRSSLGHVTLTAAGNDRLRSGAAGGSGRMGRFGLRRIADTR